MTTFHYGVKSKFHLIGIVTAVCTALAYGQHDIKAELLVNETCAVETKLGTYPDDNPERLGVGVTQIDQICLDDIKKEGELRHFKIIKEQFGYDIPTVELADLAFDPTLAVIICRLAYKRIPKAIPDTVSGRAAYWKKYYNTYHPNAKGTPAKYKQAVNECLGAVHECA